MAIINKLRATKQYLENKLRSFLRSNFFQDFVCSLLYFYLHVVFYTSRKRFINWQLMAKNVEDNRPLIIVFWHNRLVMMPFIKKKTKKLNPQYEFLILASRHFDGQFVTKIMDKFGLATVSGSSKMGRNNNRGIEVSSFRKIFKSLENNVSLAVTPDGPRGPAQKINGEIIEISKISKVPIIPISYSSSNYFRLKSWDRLVFPLPFSTICYYFGEIITIDENASEEEVVKIKLELENKMNEVQQKSDDFVL